ncbi:nucleotidyl transferase AbiEii/AbiGii toxin family protein [Lacticigenium naphthae]|uniref:nucleotidyl transferase AbiEii/AbiGii toxin family protein n=1 Tax=Lacticigenium naphthae TaxID=515351 RepID=UPI0004263281|nr:nucleotidyl transferase AbiEii/AbiGii toxin family protein [Lacticigenium naphthae]
MVHGIEKFKEYFSKYSDQYVLIGGTASDILMTEMGVPFRATKDLDIVLIVEALDSYFIKDFWNFIEEGGYEYRERNTGKEQFYRFSNPKHLSFPKMIELFSKRPVNFNLKFESGLIPIHVEESIVSLSAILLDDAYYNLLLEGKTIVEGYSVLKIETIILFKIKAWLDLSERKREGESIDSKNIKKHKNDIFRLLVNVDPSKRINKQKEITNDLMHFNELIYNDKPDLKNLGIRGANFEELMRLFRKIFL